MFNIVKSVSVSILLIFAVTGKASNIGSLDGSFVIGEARLSKLITAAAVKYKLERRLLSCLYFVESTYTLNVISRTRDHGIGQINVHTAKGFKMDIALLTTDLAYSVDRSAFILNHYRQLKQAEEPRTWICRYNVGPGPLTKRGRGGACETYLERINRCRVSNLAVL